MQGLEQKRFHFQDGRQKVLWLLKAEAWATAHEVPFLSSQGSVQSTSALCLEACWEHTTNHKKFVLHLATMTRRKVSFQKRQNFLVTF